MAVYSMTGFARVQVGLNEQVNYTLSLKSVNHRFLDLQLRMPSGLDALEMTLRKMLKERLVRGHVELSLQVDRGGQQKAGYNRELIAAYIAAFAAAREEHGLTGEPDMNAVLRLPGALNSDNRNSDEGTTELAESVQAELPALLEQLKAMRAREGESLVEILRAHLDRLAEATAGVEALRPEIEKLYQERLTQRLQSATGPEFNRQRLLEEVAVLVDRSDVAEELARMQAHIAHFHELLTAGGEVGKKLDFLRQEMNREANTIGYKANDTEISHLSVKLKEDIEKIREQIQNIE